MAYRLSFQKRCAFRTPLRSINFDALLHSTSFTVRDPTPNELPALPSKMKRWFVRTNQDFSVIESRRRDLEAFLNKLLQMIMVDSFGHYTNAVFTFLGVSVCVFSNEVDFQSNLLSTKAIKRTHSTRINLHSRMPPVSAPTILLSNCPDGAPQISVTPPE
jgi:hypothetical protein